jgi:alkylation response protein AidB-like acyl-CoA dehydrogenase/flavin-dependent dehydrogenase/ferredoxin-like protein FixX
MSLSQYDVVVVGAGAAGLSAAIGLARNGFSVIVVEAAAYPGAENWSGCVYFCENLAHPDLLGPARVDTLAWERRLVERGIFATDGYSLLGMTYREDKSEIRNPKSDNRNVQSYGRTFRHCYTVLRPIYDHHLAQVAARHGVAILTETTAESLIRDGQRVIGVCTQRGPIYADLVFLAEGDASHLVTREGYERFSSPNEVPKFLQGIKQVIDLPQGAIESIFGLGADEGAAYEILIRNGRLRGQDLHLNMGGFVYTNRQSLSIGLVLPLDNLKNGFGGNPNLLMEWFENLPAFKPWLREGKRGVFGAKLIRGGGVKDIPQLVDHGLAIGGAASGIGIDFPYPNFTGPATGMGLLLAQAVGNIRRQGGDFTRENLAKHYLEPLQRTNYWNDVVFLRRWPAYVKGTETFFGVNLDLLLGTAYVWTRPKRWLPAKWINWLRLLIDVAGPAQWRQMRQDTRHLIRSARLAEVIDRPAWIQLILNGAINGFRDLFRSPRPNLPLAGIIRVHYSVAGGDEPTGLASRLLRRWFRRFAPILSAAAHRVYSNDNVALQIKLPEAMRLLIRQINLFDVVIACGIAVTAWFTGAIMIGWNRLLKFVGLRRSGKPQRGLYQRYAQAVSQVADLTPTVPRAAQAWESRLAGLAYDSAKESHIHLNWPRSLPDKNAVVDQGLWNICPAHVYEARVNAGRQLQVVVNFENCIKCETCWRGSDLVDWGRDGRHRFRYPVHSPAVARLVEAVQAAAIKQPTPLRIIDPWKPLTQQLARTLEGKHEFLGENATHLLSEATQVLDQLACKLQEFDLALSKEPRNIDRARAEYLEMLARYSEKLAANFLDLFQRNRHADGPNTNKDTDFSPIIDLSRALLAKSEERAKRTWTQHFSWAAADGRQILSHHIPGLRHYLKVLADHAEEISKTDISSSINQTSEHSDFGFRISDFQRLQPWLRAEKDAGLVAQKRCEWSDRLDAAFPSTSWHERERKVPLSADQDALLRELISQIPVIDPKNLERTLHPPLRKMLLAELGSRDPSLAFRAASHLWTRDILSLEAPSSNEPLERWIRAEEWACLVYLNEDEGVLSPSVSPYFEALFVPAISVRWLLVVLQNQMAIVSVDHPALSIEPLSTLGLRGAGLARVQIQKTILASKLVTVDGDHARRVWSILSSADLTSIATGMANQLCRRAVAHAGSRVQFPGLFQDEESRDTIGKFGVVKKMLAEMATQRFLIETVDHALSPADFSVMSYTRAGLVKALAAECLGTMPGSLAYNAGQIFGGTGYSEDDILSKFYRDAGAWRVLGVPNVEILSRHGTKLLHGPVDEAQLHLPRETEFVDAINQRQALQAEFEETRNDRARWQELLLEWRENAARSQVDQQGYESTVAYVREALSRLDGELMGVMAILLRTHARLELGQPSDLELAQSRVWLNHVSSTRDEIEARLRMLTDEGQRNDRPFVSPSVGPPVQSYADYLASPGQYDSGDFLIRPVDQAEPRLVPELIGVDPILAEREQELKSLISAHFSKSSKSEQLYERFIENQHRPDSADLDFCREHGFFRMTIPKEHGGEGRPKIDYYLLTTNLQRLADVSMSLTVQVNTSIGTTPVLLANDKDLPKAQKDLQVFLDDPAQQLRIQNGLEKLTEISGFPDFSRIKAAVRELHGQLEIKILSRPVFRALGHKLFDEWSGVRHMLADNDLSSLPAQLRKASEAWRGLCGRAQEFGEELSRRRDACVLFLKWVANGQISAFALTEPSAGSDTARLVTRAKLRSVSVEDHSNGAYQFVPVGGGEPRTLLEAQRLEFPSRVPHYRWSPNAEPVPIHFEEYDYETDHSDRRRFYECQGQKIYFTDIAQLRRRDGKLWYDYWELTGAKMWITNGRMAGVMCLYARTPEGITGFMVDRHSEGLIVGKDESKMGQCGSPTNELSLQAVRVPRENVIGLEGRGQVNALESLNVGRAGLAMSALAPMRGLIESCREFARNNIGKIPSEVQWRLDQMEEDRFTVEAMAYELVGRFEHSGTGSVRLESAIGKMLTSELLLSVINQAEEIHGLAGQTELHLIEKRKRDARVLTIYEGTNEIQRFFILKDLASEVAPRWKKSTAPPTPHLGREALDFEALKLQFRQRLESALECFSSELWQNPNLQANCFVMSEAAAWLKGADSTLARLAWHELKANAPFSTLDLQILQTGRRALVRCYDEVRNRLHRFDEELMHLRRGYYPPEVQAASLLLQNGFTTALYGQANDLLGTNRRPQSISILVVVESTAANIPHPQVIDGRLLEPYLPLSESSRSALEVALQLRDQARLAVSIETISVGPAATAQVLRELLSLGVNRVRLIVPEADVVTSASAAVTAATVLGSKSGFDLILGPEEASDQEDGLLSRLLAAALKIRFVGSAAQLTIKWDELSRQSEEAANAPGESKPQPASRDGAPPGEWSLHLIDSSAPGRRSLSLPAALSIRPGLSLRDFTTYSYLANLSRNVEIVRWPRSVPAGKVEWYSLNGSFSCGDSPADQTPRLNAPTTADCGLAAVPEAAGLLLKELGLGGMSSVPDAYQGSFQEVENPALIGGSRAKVIGIIKADAGRLKPTAITTLKALGLLASVCRAEPVTLLLVPPNEEIQRIVLAQCLATYRWDVVLLVTEALSLPAVCVQVLIESWPALSAPPRIVIGEPWAEMALASLAGRSQQLSSLTLRIRKMASEQRQVVLTTSRTRGKLQTRQTLEIRPGVTSWIGLAPEAEVQGGRETRSDQPIVIQRWSPSMARLTRTREIQQLIEEAKKEVGVVRLAEAEFIVDVGFGVGNRDGYEIVIEPLERTLRQLGGRNLVIGGSRKVTEELHLLPADRQIGQSGISVNPRIILAIGISGAPQHLNYIGPRAVILAFNRDPEAPIMTLNQRQARPRVFPVVGDLFETVPAFIAALGEDTSASLQM